MWREEKVKAWQWTGEALVDSLPRKVGETALWKTLARSVYEALPMHGMVAYIERIDCTMEMALETAFVDYCCDLSMALADIV